MRLPSGDVLNQFFVLQRATTNSTVTILKLKGCLVAYMHRGEMEIWWGTTYTIVTCNMRSMNQGKQKTIKQEIKHLNIAVLSVGEIKRTLITQQHKR